MIDLRSDTITRPTPEMRKAMYEAEVGDDVFGEDPTVRALETYFAELLGKEAALFVTSGTMGNQLAVKVHTQAADEVIVEAGCHIQNYESGAAGFLANVQLRSLQGVRGILTPTQVKEAIRPAYYWEPRTRLVCLENTHNKAGGVVYPLETIEAIGEVVKSNGLAFHLDGARLWNATAATGISEAVYAAPFDSVSVCLSKGLGAPVGSVLLGSAAFIKEAHRYRKMWGGGMRQAGSLAAAGLYAVRHHRQRLAEDHANAKRLAEGLAAFSCFSIDTNEVETNIVMFHTQTIPALDVLAKIQSLGVRMVPFGPYTIRATTHLDLTAADIEDVLRRFHTIFE